MSKVSKFFKMVGRGALACLKNPFFYLALFLFVGDLVSKQVIKNTLKVGDWIGLIPGDGSFLAITYVQNNGMAFGIDFKDKLVNTAVFITISIVGFLLISALLVHYWKKTGKFVKCCLFMMLAGCLGNLIDRCFYIDEVGNHYVVDWIAFFGKGGFPRFNIADASLVVAVIMLIIYLIVEEVKEAGKNREIEVAMAKDKALKEAEANKEAPKAEENKIEVSKEEPKAEEPKETKKPAAKKKPSSKAKTQTKKTTKEKKDE